MISGFEGHEKINVIAMEIPFWSMTDFKGINTRLYEALEQSLKDILY
jgi:hypothetical protein